MPKHLRVGASSYTLAMPNAELLLTRVVDPSDHRIRDLIHVPLYSLAEWLATNWWSLLHESESQSATPITRSRPQATTKPLSANLSPRRSQPVAENGPARGHSDFRCSLPVLPLPSAAQRPLPCPPNQDLAWKRGEVEAFLQREVLPDASGT